MYLHIGNGKAVRKKNVIGIFDMDKTTLSGVTKKFLSDSEKNGNVCSVSNDIPKSFILTDDKIYISQISAQAITSRAGTDIK